MDEKQLRDIAGQLSRPHGDGAIAIGEKMNETNLDVTRRSIETLAPQAGERIVEIGPGNAVLSLPIIESIGTNGAYTGLELSEEMARKARETLSKSGVTNYSILAGDCRSAPVDARSIDALIAVNVLYFIDEISEFFGTVSQWLKPGGRAVFGLRSDQSLSAMPFTRYGFRIRSVNEIMEQLNASGFADVDFKYFDEGIGKLGDLEIPVDSLIVKAIAS